MRLKSIIQHLTREELLPILKIQTTVLKEIEDFMVNKGFLQLMPIITSKFTDPLGPDPGSSVIKQPSFEYYGQKLVLTQSMILHKQLALLTGAKKIFIFSPNVRLERKERIKSGKHLFEFTQMDFEIEGAKMWDVMELVEELVISVMKKVKTKCKEELNKLERKLKIPKKGFKIYTTHELKDKFGKNWEIEASKREKYPFWVICHKREFYDKEDPERPGHYLNYDLIWPEGYGEALSGGEKEWEYERLVKRMKKDGLNLNLYKEYLKVAKMGLLKPSAGAGLGIERFVRFLAGKKHIMEIQLFPRVPGKKVLL